MTYVIEGIDPGPYTALYQADDAALAARGIVRMRAENPCTMPCRVSLEDASPGETLLLLNHESRGPKTPYHARHAIFVREGETRPARFADRVPPVMAARRLSLRAFDGSGMMVDALLTEPGEADAGLRRLFESLIIVEVDVHNAVRGCFAARARRA